VLRQKKATKQKLIFIVTENVDDKPGSGKTRKTRTAENVYAVQLRSCY